MKKFTKFLSVFMTAIMTLGMLIPNMAFAAEDEVTETKQVTLHKLLMSETQLADWKTGAVEIGANEGKLGGYNGTQDLAGLNAILDEMKHHQVNEIAGVYFVVKTVGTDAKYVLKETQKVDGKDQYTYTDVAPTKETKDNYVGGLTEANGLVIDTTKLPQEPTEYEIEEILHLSTYVGEEGETLTDSLAVPVKITLPLVNENGVVENAHVFPKNTENKPEVNKKLNDEVVNPGQDGLYGKAVDYNIGDMVPFQITTTTPANTHYKTAFWNDQMSEGLTFTEAKAGLTVTIDGTVLTKDNHYTVSVEGNGFEVKLTDAGLALINNDKKSTITIDYSAELNEEAIVDVPEENTVIFHYGNNPGEGNTPIPGHPKDQKIKVTKNFANFNGSAPLPWPAGLEIKVNLYCVENPTKILETKTLTSTNKSAEFTGLDNTKEYFVEEVYPKGYFAEYSEINENGELTITNNKTDNPEPIKPEQPQVITYGKKFVKTNVDGTERLEGAKFVITNKDEDKFLKTLSAEELATAKQTFKDAKEALDKAVAAGVPEDLVKAQKAYNEAYIQAQIKYVWTDDKTDANLVTLTSNDKGQFEIKGLVEGDYWLKETESPEGFAKLGAPIKFVVGPNTYTTVTVDIDWSLEDEDTSNDAQQVINKKISIPQTGGIGTAIFIIAGIALMGGAFVAMKRQEA